jgi:hypothetical protein
MSSFSCFGYPGSVLSLLVFMIVSGAGRTIAVKVYFQLGYNDPLMMALIFLFSHLFAGPMYLAEIALRKNVDETAIGETAADDSMIHSDSAQASAESSSSLEKNGHDIEDGYMEQQQMNPNQLLQKNKLGSQTGLTYKSKQAVQWVHRIPWPLKPLVSSILNIFCIIFRMLPFSTWQLRSMKCWQVAWKWDLAC